MKHSSLTAAAWAAWNASYNEPHVEAYRVVGAALYRQALHERIQTLFDQLDEQNARLDALLAARQSATQAEPDGFLVESTPALPCGV
jgi:hypothetical protein